MFAKFDLKNGYVHFARNTEKTRFFFQTKLLTFKDTCFTGNPLMNSCWNLLQLIEFLGWIDDR